MNKPATKQAREYGSMMHSDAVRNAKIVGVAIKTTLELAAEAFIASPCGGVSNWGDLEAAMHAWQEWVQLDDAARERLAFDLNEVPIEKWTRTIAHNRLQKS